jgi:predicted acylesterase/phospholipase RssA
MRSDRPKSLHGFQISLDEKTTQLIFSYYIKPPEIRSVVFKGGGGRVWIYLSLLEYLEKNNLLNQIKEFGGSSGGALVSVFAALPLTSKERIQAIQKLELDKAKDILGDSIGSSIYKIITTPQYIISKSLEVIGNSFDWCGHQLNQTTGNRWIGMPLRLMAQTASGFSFLTHPYFPAGIYNLVTTGGICRGDRLHNNFRKSIYENTTKCLEYFLNEIKGEDNREKIIRQLRKTGLIEKIEKINGIIKIKLTTENITFHHFNQLAMIDGSGFKDVFITAARYKGVNHLKIFNYKNTPDMTLYDAIRFSISTPILFKKREYNGETYIDGGCSNNFPIQYATKGEYDLPKEYKQLHLDVLGVRVEYQNEMGFLFQPENNLLKGFMEHLSQRIIKIACGGIDLIQEDEKSVKEMKKNYSHRVIQFNDQGRSFSDFSITSEKLELLLQSAAQNIKDYFSSHQNEILHLENFSSIDGKSDNNQKGIMHNDLKKVLYEYLKEKSNTNESIFYNIPASHQKKIRIDLIKQLEKHLEVKEIYTTQKIYQTLGIKKFECVNERDNNVESRDPLQEEKMISNNELKNVILSSDGVIIPSHINKLEDAFNHSNPMSLRIK